MPEEAEQQAADAAGGTADAEYAGVPAPVVEEIRKLKQYNLELRKENEKRRKAEEAAEAERKRREQEAMAEQGKWRELAEQREAELQRLAGLAERAERYEALVRQQNEARLARIPEVYRKLAPTDYSPEQLAAWLDANEAVLMRPQAPNLDVGQRGEAKRPIDARTTLKRRSY